MSFKIEGKLHFKGATQQVSATFQKREFVVQYAENPQYPQLVKFESMQERTALIEPFNLGETIEVNFNLRGREWQNPKGETVYFTTLEAWRIQAVGATNVIPAEEKQKAPEYDLTEAQSVPADDLPF